MFRRTWAVVLGTLLLIFGMTVSASAAQRGTDRPFRATASGHIDYAANELQCPAGFTTVVTAAGQATHLGSFNLAARHCEAPTGPGTGVSYLGEMTLTAANGDQVFGTYTTAWAFNDGKVTVTGWLDVTGGTGRFTGATGKLWQHHVISVVSENPPWPLQMGFQGAISY